MHALNFVYDTLKIRTRVARVWIKTQVCWKFGICQDEFSWGYLPMTSVIISCKIWEYLSISSELKVWILPEVFISMQ